MTRESRTLFLSILTLVVYATSIFISQGSFVFPFPLNEFILFAVSAQFFWWNRERNKFAGILAVVSGLFAVLSTQFFWTFIYGPEKLIYFMDSLVTDYFLIGFYVLVVIAGIATMMRQKKGIALLFGGLFIMSFISGAFLNQPLLILLGYGFMVASTQLTKVFVPYHLLWILLMTLELTKVLTFFLNT